MRRRRLFACAGALALLGAGPPGPISLHTLEGDESVVERGPEGPDQVLHFWATWCPECIEELPALGRAAQGCDPARVKVIAVNVGEKPEQVRAYINEHSLTLPVLLDPGGKAWREAGLWGLPANLWWTGAGIRTEPGASSAAEWRQALGELGCSE